VLKQELLYTQQSLAASEKVIDKLKEDLRKSESDRIRLNQYKTSKAQRLEELEGKVRKFEVMDNINLEKLIDALGNKER
jgi:chromosome segregation ATPase